MASFDCEFYAKSLGRRVHLSLEIPSLDLRGTLQNENPAYYQQRRETYPLLLCLHGFGDNKEAWTKNTSLSRLASRHGFAFAAIEGENSWYRDLGPLQNHETFLETDVLDFLYGNFSNLSPSAPLAIMGVSMGGYGALFHYLRHKDKYLGAIALSPAIHSDIPERPGESLQELFAASPSHNRIYLSVGKKDFILPQSEEFDAWLTSHTDVSYRYVPSADHSWATWDQELPRAIFFLQSIGFIGETPTTNTRESRKEPTK